MGGYCLNIKFIEEEIRKIQEYLISKANCLKLNSEEEFILIERIKQLKKDAYKI